MLHKMTFGSCELWTLYALNYKLSNTNSQTHHYMHKYKYIALVWFMPFNN